MLETSGTLNSRVNKSHLLKAYGPRYLGALIAEFLGSKCRAMDTVVRYLSLVWDCVVLHHVWVLPYTTGFVCSMFSAAPPTEEPGEKAQEM